MWLSKKRFHCLEKKRANDSIYFNEGVIFDETDKGPVRSYCCVFCASCRLLDLLLEFKVALFKAGNVKDVWNLENGIELIEKKHNKVVKNRYYEKVFTIFGVRVVS